jgi:hypothetical protein
LFFTIDFSYAYNHFVLIFFFTNHTFNRYTFFRLFLQAYYLLSFILEKFFHAFSNWPKFGYCLEESEYLTLTLTPVLDLKYYFSRIKYKLRQLIMSTLMKFCFSFVRDLLTERQRHRIFFYIYCYSRDLSFDKNLFETKPIIYKIEMIYV